MLIPTVKAKEFEKFGFKNAKEYRVTSNAIICA